MTLVQIGALRFHGLDADIASLPVGNTTLFGSIFDAVDTVRKFVFDGTAWNEFISGTGEDNTGANVGAGTGLVFRDKLGVTLNFKTLIGGTNITVTDNSDDITIASTGSSPLTTKGDIFGFSTLDDRIPVGIDGQVLQAQSGEALGLKYVDLVFTKGQLISFDTQLTQLAVGTDGQILQANSVEITGLEWIDPATLSSPLTTKGDLFGFDTGDQRIPVGSEGQILSSVSAVGVGVAWVDDVNKTLTTKGDILSRTLTVEARLPIGTDGQRLEADSAEITGLKWVTPVVASSDRIESADTNTNVVTANGSITTTLSSVPVVLISGSTIATELDLNIKNHFQDWAEMAVPSNPLDSQARMYQYVQDVNNSPMAVKFKVNGSVQIVRFF